MYRMTWDPAYTCSFVKMSKIWDIEGKNKRIMSKRTARDKQDPQIRTVCKISIHKTLETKNKWTTGTFIFILQ